MIASDRDAPDATGFHEVGPVGVLRMDGAGLCLDVDAAGCAILGVGREDVLGRGWQRLLPALERAGLARPGPAPLAAGARRGECRCAAPDGRALHLEVDWMPEADGGARCAIRDVTAQRRAEAAERAAHGDALRRLEEIELLYRNAPVGLCVVDADLRFVRVNRLMALFDQRSEQEHVGRSMEEVLPEAARAQAIAIARRVLATGEAAINVEVHTVSPRDPAREHWWLVSCHPVRRGGRVTALLSVLQNATAIKRAEQEAQRRLDELEALYRNSPVGLGLLDRELRYVRVNEVLARFNGRTVDEHRGRTPEEVIPSVASAVVPLLRRVLAEGRSVREELHLRPPSDPQSEHDYVVTYDPVRTADGAIAGVVGTVSDVTACKRAERAALERLEELELIYQSSPVGLAYLDADMRYVRVNDLLARIDGRPVAEHLGRRMDEIAPQLAGQLVPLFRKALLTGRPVLGEELTGAERWDPERRRTWLTSWHPIRAGTGEVRGVIAVVKDVTPLKRRQAALEETSARLAKAEQVASVGSWEWNILTDEVWWSDELYALFGRDRRSFVPDTNSFYEQVRASDRPKLREQYEATLARDVPYQVRFRVLRSDGSERLVRACAQLERAPDGLPVRLFGTCQDVTGLEEDPVSDPSSAQGG